MIPSYRLGVAALLLLLLPITHGEVKDGFAQNINVVTEQANVSRYLRDRLVKTATAELPDWTLVSRSAFATKSGLKGVRIASTWKHNGTRMRQIAYVFPGKSGRKYVATYTCKAEDCARNDRPLDASIKTFRLL